MVNGLVGRREETGAWFMPGVDCLELLRAMLGGGALSVLRNCVFIDDDNFYEEANP